MASCLGSIPTVPASLYFLHSFSISLVRPALERNNFPIQPLFYPIRPILYTIQPAASISETNKRLM